jgi:hypothetical protein
MTMRPEALLGQRIAEIAFPEAEQLAARVIHRYHAAETSGRRGAVRWSRRRRLLPAAAVAVVLLVTIVSGTGMGPALANSPLISPVVARLLSTIGVSAARDHVTPLAVSSRSAGQTISVVAGYADSTRTVIVVQVSPSRAEPVTPTLIDGSGSAMRSDGVMPGRRVTRSWTSDPSATRARVPTR